MTGPVVAVVDYGIGNLRSAERALLHVGADARLTASPADIAAAEAVVLPGVGAFGACMRALDTAGLREAALAASCSGRPFLGICVGMQMLFDSSAEDDHSTLGLGVLPGTVEWLATALPRPQMQWNRLDVRRADPMFDGIGERPWMYFVHSLHGVPRDEADVAATCDYGDTLNAAFRRGSVFATQFHPEKSGAAGLGLLANFVKAVS